MATIREMQAVFKASASNMRAGVQKLKDDFEGLKKKTDETSKSIGDKMYAGFDKMQRGGEKMRKVGGSFSKYVTAPIAAGGGIAFKAANDIDKAFSIIRTGTGATGDDLEKLKGSFRTVFADVPEDAEAVGTALADINTRTGLTGEALEDMTKQFLDLGRITGEDVPTLIANGTRVFGDWNIATEDQADTLDYLFKVSQNTGIGVNDLMQKVVQFGSPMRQMGFEFDETAAIMAKFEKEGVNAELVMGSMRQGLGYFAREGIDAKEGLMQTIEAIQQAGSESEATGIAMEVFGARAGPDMASAIREGRFDLEELLSTIESSPETISGAAEDSMTFGQRFSELFNEMKIAIEPFGIILLEMAEDWMPKVSKAIQAVGNWFGELTKQQREWLVILGLIGAAIGPVLLILGQLAIWIGGVGKVLTPLIQKIGAKGLSGVLKALASRLSFLFGPIGIAIGIITTLGAAFVTAYNKSETFRNFIGSIGSRIKGAIGWLRDFKDGIAGLFQDDGTGGVDILTSIGISEGMATRLNDMVGKFFEFKWKVEEIIGNVKTTIKGIFAIFKGDHTSANEILRSIGLSEETINSIFLAVANIKSAFRTTKEYVTNILSAVGIFLRAKIAEIVAFWQSDGQKILQATKNVFSGVSTAISAAIAFIVPIIRTGLNAAWSIFKFVWPAILGLIKMVWGNIKGVINGSLKFIQGLIQVFSGIFTGDFRKMWQGVKNIFSGAIQFVWNLFQLMFYGRILKGVASLVKIFAGSIRSLWTRVVSFFKSMGEGAALRVMYMRDAVVKFIVNLARRAGNAVSGMVQSIGRFFKNLYTGVTSRVANLKNAVVNRFLQLKNGAVNNIKALYDSVRAWFKNIYDNVSTRMRNAKNRAVNFARDMKDGAIEKFKALSNGARDMMDNVGKWIDRKKQAVINKATSLGTGIANAAIKGFNKLIGGINKVGSMLGIDELLNKIPLIGSGGGGSRRGSGGYAPARYSTGTSYHRGGPAIVGDKGPGNGGGTSEIVSLPNGRNWLFNKETLIDDLPTGSKVLNNRKTEKKFGAGGAGSGTDKDSKNSWFSSAKDWVSNKASSIVGGISGAYKKVTGFISDVWDYMKNPGELASKLVSNLDLGFDLPSTALDLAKGGVKKLTSHIGKFFGGWFDDAGGEVDGGSILNRRITAKFGRYPAAIARQLGVTKHYGLDTAHKYEKLTSPVTGKVTKVWHDKFGGNSIQIKSGKAHWWFMHMQSIARQVGDMVKAGKTALGITGNTGLRTTGYHLHSQKMVGGIGNKYAVDPLPDLRKAKGYFKGGITSGIPELAWLNEEGFKESIISWNPARKERSEDIWRTTGQSLGFNDSNKEELTLLKEQNKLLAGILGVSEEHKEVSESILEKDPRIVIDEFKRKYNQYNDDRTIMI